MDLDLDFNLDLGPGAKAKAKAATQPPFTRAHASRLSRHTKRKGWERVVVVRYAPAVLGLRVCRLHMATATCACASGSSLLTV